MPIAQLSRTEIFYTEHGNVGAGDPPVLFIHGWCCDGNDWIWQVDDFAEHNRVVVIDMPGYGRSGPGTDYTAQGYAADIAELIGYLELGPVIVVGHSLGGLVNLALAVEHPSLISATVNVDPAYGIGEELMPLVEAIAQQLDGEDAHTIVGDTWLHLEGPGTPPALKAWHRRRLFGVPADTVRATFNGQFFAEDPVCMRSRAAEYLGGRECPSLTIWADVERAAWEPEFLRHPYSRAIPWEGAGHWLMQERPAEFNSIVLGWIDGLRDAEAAGLEAQSAG